MQMVDGMYMKTIPGLIDMWYIQNCPDNI